LGWQAGRPKELDQSFIRVARYRGSDRPETRNRGRRPSVFRSERLFELHAQGSAQDRRRGEDFPVDAARDPTVGKGCRCKSVRDHFTSILTL
jgi:hypothetical protein